MTGATSSVVNRLGLTATSEISSAPERPTQNAPPPERKARARRPLGRLLPLCDLCIRCLEVLIALLASFDSFKELTIGTERKRLQQHTIADREHGRDRANAQRQNQHRKHSVARRAPQLPRCEAHIRSKAPHPHKNSVHELPSRTSRSYNE